MTKYIYPQGYGKSNDYLLDVLKPVGVGKTSHSVDNTKKVKQ